MEKRFEIICDGASDIPEDLRTQYGIQVLKSFVQLPDGRNVEMSNTWDVITKEWFYGELRKRPDSFSTAPASVGSFAEAFKAAVKEGKSVLAISISTGLSGTYNFMNEAASQVREEIPAADIRVVDSLRFSVGFGMLAIHAAKLREAGKSLEETEAELNEIKNTIHQCGWLDDLSFVAKKGRLTHAKAFFGSIAGVKPIGEFDYNGLTTVIGKAKGAKQAYAALLNYMEKTGIGLEGQDIWIAQTNRLPQAEEFKKMIEEKFHPVSVRIVDVFPPCGVNIGPGLMAAYYRGTPISKGLEKEREILNAFLNA